VQSILLAASLAVVSADGAAGNLFVRISAGFEVIVDGASAGMSSADQGGALISNLAPGQHKVIVRSSDGREGTFAVSINEGETTSIDVSPLGLRRKLVTAAGDELSVVNVLCIPQGCSAQFRGATANATEEDIGFDSIPAGQHSLIVTRGKNSLRMRVDVPAGSIVTVQADFTSSSIRTVETRRRPVRVQVAEANDALTPLPVPAYWKSAIRGVLPSGALVIDASLAQGNGVRVTVRVPSDRVGFSLIESLLSSTAFSAINAPSSPRRTQNGWVVDFIFYFPPAH